VQIDNKRLILPPRYLFLFSFQDQDRDRMRVELEESEMRCLYGGLKYPRPSDVGLGIALCDLLDPVASAGAFWTCLCHFGSHRTSVSREGR
jgi:hypothetical protein